MPSGYACLCHCWRHWRRVPPASLLLLRTNGRRAQREEELRAYKAKMVDDKLLADSCDVADRQPVFLKDKGDGLFKQGNYRWAGRVRGKGLCLPRGWRGAPLWRNSAMPEWHKARHSVVNGAPWALELPRPSEPALHASGAVARPRAWRCRGAINAYSRAIELDDAIPLVWANRGACHLALGGHAEAVADCTRAVQLLLGRKERWAGEVPGCAERGGQCAILRLRTYCACFHRPPLSA